MKGVIMAGGSGSRLRPLTCDRPKPMTPLLNKPVMEYAIELLKTHGITDIAVTLQYLPEHIKDYFGNGNQWGVNLHYFIEEVPLGTAGSVKNAEEFLDEPFIVVSGDALTDFNLSEAVDFHAAVGSLATLVLTTVESPLEYGVVVTHKDGRIRRFLEKPGWGEVFSDQVNTGIYILEPEVLEEIPPCSMYDFSKNLFPKILEQEKPMFGYVAEGYWCDIGNIESYRRANGDMLSGLVKLPLPGKLAEEGVRVGRDTTIDPSARIQGPVFIGDNCRIGPEVFIGSYSVLGNNVILDKGVSVKRSIIWDNCGVGKQNSLRGTILCNRVSTGHNVSLYEGSVVGDDSELGDNAVIKPDTKIWPNKIVEKGTVMRSSLIWGNKCGKNLFGRNGIPGQVNVDITPEFAARLGGAYGGVFSRGQRVLVSSDGRPGAEMVKTAFVSGLLATGTMVSEGGVLTPALHRFGMGFLGADGGVYFKSVPEECNRLRILFFDNKGIEISRDMERKIENFFHREDFKRVPGHEVPHIFPASDFTGAYREFLLQEIAGVIRQYYPGIALCSQGSPADTVVGPLLESVGIAVHKIEFQVPAGSEPESGAVYSTIAETVKKTGALFGVMLDEHGEEMVLVDAGGAVIQGESLTLLLSLVYYMSNKGGRFVVPVTAPQVIEQIAGDNGGDVCRTKTARRSLMEAKASEDEKLSPIRCKQFFLEFDPVYTISKLTDFLLEQPMTFSQLTDRIPKFHTSLKSTECPWTVKGKVMRTLIDEKRDEQNVELVDGIKVYHDQGWALVLPDAEEPVYNVYGEGFSQEIADSLTDMYLHKIESILRTEDKKT